MTVTSILSGLFFKPIPQKNSHCVQLSQMRQSGTLTVATLLFFIRDLLSAVHSDIRLVVHRC